MSGQPPEIPHFKASADADVAFEFCGPQGALLLPSLDVAPILQANGFKGLSSIPRTTISVGINSNSYNRGLGIVLEASPLMDEVEKKGWYTYSGIGEDRRARSAAVKFHPGMRGGHLRVEGFGGFDNTDIGFTPKDFDASGKKLHMLELTVGADGVNEVCIRGTEEGQSWSRKWTGQLFNGRNLPAVHAWIDMGGFEGQPLHVGPISLCFHAVPISL